MDSLQKLQLLGDQMTLEPAEVSDSAPRPLGVADPNALAACGHSPAELRRIFGNGAAPVGTDALAAITKGNGDPGSSLERKKNSLGIHPAAMPGGKRIPLLKTLLTSACERDCYYCPFRARRNFRRVTFKPEEMARTFVELHQAGAAEGLFLSSGIA